MKQKMISTLCITFIAVTLYSRSVCADSTVISMLPPTPLGSTAICPGGMQDILSYSGTEQGGAQGGINCVPIATDAQGDMAASGYIQMSYSAVACDGAHAGAIRFNPSNGTFEGCTGSSWQGLGGSAVQMYRCPYSTQLADGGAWASIGCIGQISGIPTCTNIVANPPRYPTVVLGCTPL